MIDIQKIAEKIRTADAVLAGASNGFSISEGLHIFADNEDFRRLFGDFRQTYGIGNILQGLFFRWPSEETRWAFTSRLISRYSAGYTGSPLMDSVKKILDGKPYFIVTSNGENHFELAGLDPQRILEIEGRWKEMRCAAGCHDALYPTWDAVSSMAARETGGLVPSELVPRCPKCGAPMAINFHPSAKQENAYRAFLQEHRGKKLLILEFGIGARNQLIKAPLMRLAAQEPNAFYITFNKGELYIPAAIRDKSMGVDGNLGEILPQIAARL